MKKPDSDCIQLQKRRQIRCRRKQFIERSRRVRSRQRHLLRGFLAPKTVKSPVIFALENPKTRRDFLTFMARFRRRVAEGHKFIRLDLRNVKRLFPACTLLFAAEVSRVVESGRVPMLRCLPPKASKPRQVLKQLGILRQLRCHVNDVPKDQDVVHWKLAKGNDVRGEKFEETVGHFDGMIADALSGGLYNGMVEAMKNSKQHAYLADREDGLDIVLSGGPWWMLSQQRDGNLFVAFCDLGIGIPKSLPKRWPEALSTFAGRNDSTMIRAAAELGRSRTELKFRGRGLTHICEDVMAHGEGSVLIHSNRGRYQIVRNQDGTSGRIVSDYRESIMGTIITWKVALETKDHD